jgi:hypothetical protein
MKLRTHYDIFFAEACAKKYWFAVWIEETLIPRLFDLARWIKAL